MPQQFLSLEAFVVPTLSQKARKNGAPSAEEIHALKLSESLQCEGASTA
jgi:hypothetical protein